MNLDMNLDIGVYAHHLGDGIALSGMLMQQILTYGAAAIASLLIVLELGVESVFERSRILLGKLGALSGGIKLSPPSNGRPNGRHIDDVGLHPLLGRDGIANRRCARRESRHQTR